MNKLGLVILGGLLILLSTGCKRETLDFDELSEKIGIDRQIAIPLVYGNLNIREMAEENSDSLIIIDGDTVKLVFRNDSIFHITIQELLDIPEQSSTNYTIIPTKDTILPPVNARIEIPSLIKDTLFPFSLENSIKLDSLILNESNLNFEVINEFQQTITLIVISTSLISPSGEFFIDSIENIMPGIEPTVAQFPIDNYTVRTFPDATGNTAITMRFAPVIFITPTENTVSQTDYLSIDFGIDNIEDFNAIFGFFGYQNERVDTNIYDFAPEIFNGLEGSLSVTQPKLILNYQNSIGVETNIDMLLNLDFASSPNVSIPLGQQTMGYSDNYLNPVYEGSFIYDENNAPNIDQLIALPMPETINAIADAETNQGLDTTTLNWALKESEIIIDLTFEVPLELTANLTYLDTLKIRDEAPEESEESYEVEYAELHYTFKNYFPIGFGGELIIYDSIADVVLDTINLNPEMGLLVKPAPVNQKGNVIRSEVEEYKDKIILDVQTAEIILNEATHLIFKAALITSDKNYNSVNSVRVGADSELNYQFGIDAKGKYISNL